jgi:ComF family protein
MEGTVREAVHALKYQGVRALAPTLVGLLAGYVSRNSMPVDVIVAVPLHPRRERSRGYNQSALLAQAMGDVLGVSVENGALRRLRQTPPQANSAGEEERRTNVSGAFEAEASLVRGRKMVVIDDVCTTGATLEACAMVLHSAGAASVWGLTLALET